MNISTQNVRIINAPIAKSFYSRLIADSIRQIRAKTGMSETALAQLCDCKQPTINNASNQIGHLCGFTAFNLILADPTAVDPILNYFGRRSVTIGAKCDTDALDAVTDLTHKLVTKQQDPRDVDTAISVAIEALVSLQNERAA